MKKLAIAACAAVMAMAMAGCAQQTALDREVDVADMTLSVPSSWVEDSSEYDGYSTFEEGFGSSIFSEKDGDSGISVGYSDIGLSDTPEEEMEQSEEFYTSDPVNATDFEYSLKEESVIDGAECVVYEYSYKVKDKEGNQSTSRSAVAYITTPEIQYDISVWGPDVKIDSVLETVSL